jgi:uncharacterized YigZ family protein
MNFNANHPYQTVAAGSAGTYRERGSRFLAFLHPLEQPEDHRTQVARYRNDHPKAAHVCQAYRLRTARAIEEFSSDDGEPSSSAGRPMLNQLRAAALENAGLYVVRYFGGVKLGVPGLIHAYKTAAQAAIEAAELVFREPTLTLHLRCPLEHLDTLMRWLSQQPGRIVNQHYDSDCRIALHVSLSDYPKVKNALPYAVALETE